jgi:aldehyde dehydrogenase (NAD+)
MSLVAAVAAGNRVTLKPSELTPTSQIISKIVSETFSTDDVTVKTGDATVAAALLEQRWDYIFYRKVQSSSQYLTPVTLELGESPLLMKQQI